MLTAFLIVAVFSAAGHLLFDLFGITLPSFRIAGGFLVALVGFHLLQGNTSPVHKPKDADLKESKEADIDMAISPLAIPLLAGPGTLVTAMSYAAGGGPERIGLVLAAFFLICVLTYICFVTGERLTVFLGKNLLMVVSRLMGLILTVIGTEMVIQGIRGAIAPRFELIAHLAGCVSDAFVAGDCSTLN